MEGELRTKLRSLLALQNEYIQLVEEESEEYAETLSYYIELLGELKQTVKRSSMKLARTLIQNEDFQHCLTSANASLYVPILEFVCMTFKGHKLLAPALLSDVPEMLLLLLQEISIHLKYAFESLLGDEQRDKRSRSRSTSQEEISDCLYSVNEAKSIAELTAKVIKSLVDSDTTLFIVMECPQVTEYLSKCSTLMNSRDFSRLAMVLIEEEEKVREIELKTAAAIIIQSFWRAIIQQRKWQKMKNGFVQLQGLFRRKLRNREGDLWRDFRASERKFNLELRALKEKRQVQEKMLESIRKTPASQMNLLYSREKETAAMKIQDYWRSHKESTTSEPPQQEIVIDTVKEQAAIVIQVVIRKWLHQRLRANVVKSQRFLNLPITEERASKLQQDIDSWQHHHKIPPMTPTELADLHHRAQLRYAKYCQGLIKVRKKEQKTMAVIAQSNNLIGILDSKPDLHSYNPQEDWKKFHSLPLHVATKARLDHNAAMARLEMPSWQRLLLSDHAI